MKRNFSCLAVYWVLLVVAIVSGCVQIPDQEPFVAPVFPPPPEEPRFYFENTLFGTHQVGSVDSTTKWRRLLTGESKSGIGFGKPFDVSVCQGRVYVSDSVRRIVIGFDFPGGRSYAIGDEDLGGLVKPLGVATDANCNVYVADSTPKRIMVYDKDGKYITAFGGPEFFERLSHLTVDPDGSRVFAVDTGGVESDAHRIQVFEIQSGEHLLTIGKRGSAEGELNLPRDIEMSVDGNLYVVDSGNFRVQVFKPDGTHLRSFGGVGRRVGQFARPKGIASDPDGNIYVSDASHGNFQIFTSEGQLLLFIGGRSSRMEPAKYTLPAGIDVDEDGRVYFVGQFFKKIDVFRPAALAADQGYLGVWSKRIADAR